MAEPNPIKPSPAEPNPITPKSIEPVTGESFLASELDMIAEFSQGLPVTFKPGDGWAVDPESGEATYDPKFFTDQGYSRTQSLFATAHEIDHAVELSGLLSKKEGREIYQRRKETQKSKRRLHRLQNSIKDVADNQRVLRKAPAWRDETEKLYREKLFPNTDFRGDSRHLQFAHAILRQAMLPDEVLQLAPEVENALNELRHVKTKKGKIVDVIKIVTDPKLDLLSKLKILEQYIEPVYEKLFEQDVEDKKNQDKQQGKPEKSNPEDYFNNEYQDDDVKMPQPMDENAQETAATGENKQGGKSSGDRQVAAYKAEHQVDAKDVADYRKEYEKIKQYLPKMIAQMRRIIAERLIPIRKLAGLKDEGAMIEPGLSAQAQVEFSSGNFTPYVFRDFEGRVRKEEVPAGFEFTCVLDRSGSMSGSKAEEQRRAAILAMETLKEFMDQPEIKRQQIDPEMVASSEIWSFGGAVENVQIKPLSSELTEKQRIETYKILANCSGGSTEDYVVLEEIGKAMQKKELERPGYLKKIKDRRLKKIVAVFSDGASSSETDYAKQKKTLENMGVKVVEFRRIKDGENFTQHMSQILSEALDDLCYTKNKPQNKI